VIQRATPHLKLMTEYDLSLRPYYFKDKHNFLSDPHAIKVTTFAFIFKANFIKIYIYCQIPCSPEGKRKIPQSNQGQNRQFADRRGDSTRNTALEINDRI
jgi:hypothetical protein